MLCIGSMTRKLLIKHFVIDRFNIHTFLAFIRTCYLAICTVFYLGALCYVAFKKIHIQGFIKMLYLRSKESFREFHVQN